MRAPSSEVQVGVCPTIRSKPFAPGNIAGSECSPFLFEAGASMPRRPLSTARKQTGQRPDIPGFLIVDSSGTPIYLNDEAVRILSYPERSPGPRNGGKILLRAIQTILPHLKERLKRFSAREIRSGRRTYLCRSFSVAPANRKNSWPIGAVLLERDSATKDILLIGAKYHLTQREQEAVQLLSHGLTSKEIADRMGISPNTVKAFLRLVMIKTGVTTRSGIVGRLLQA